jgi:tRNA (guanine37-N1)-methyltransferase
MRIDVVSLFPGFVKQVTEWGVTGRAVERGLLNLQCWNPRDYAQDRHRTVDDRPYGGGPGMVMKVEPLLAALNAARAATESQAKVPAKVIYLSPQGERFTQTLARELASRPAHILLCGRYEGLDERLIEQEVDLELSIGDYVLSGGELGAMVLIDAMTRLLPGVLGDDESATQDSFMAGLLDHPHYTRPELLKQGGREGRTVPSALLSGDHAAIARWRLKQALGRTWLRRPDLLDELQLNAEQQNLLREWIDEHLAGRQTDQD